MKINCNCMIEPKESLKTFSWDTLPNSENIVCIPMCLSTFLSKNWSRSKQDMIHSSPDCFHKHVISFCAKLVLSWFRKPMVRAGWGKNHCFSSRKLKPVQLSCLTPASICEICRNCIQKRICILKGLLNAPLKYVWPTWTWYFVYNFEE